MQSQPMPSNNGQVKTITYISCVSAVTCLLQTTIPIACISGGYAAQARSAKFNVYIMTVPGKQDDRTVTSQSNACGRVASPVAPKPPGGVRTLLRCGQHRS